MQTVQNQRRIPLLAAVAIAAGLATSATAQETQFDGADAAGGSGAQVVDATMLDEIMASFQRNGFSVELTEDSQGDPRIRSTDRSNPFSLYFYGCTENKDCGYVQFSAGWDLENGITLAKMEEWNANRLWGTAYRDDEKDPWLTLTVNLKYGITVENLDDTVDWWKVTMPRFAEHIGFE
jgi:hypothetical protein